MSRRIQKARRRNKAWLQRKLLRQNRWTENKVPVHGPGPSKEEITEAELKAAAYKAAKELWRPREQYGSTRLATDQRRRTIEKIVWHKIKTKFPTIFRFFHADQHYFVQVFDDGTERRSVVYKGLLSAIVALNTGAITWE